MPEVDETINLHIGWVEVNLVVVAAVVVDVVVPVVVVVVAALHLPAPTLVHLGAVPIANS
jgi:hypothetical protein